MSTLCTGMKQEVKILKIARQVLLTKSTRSGLKEKPAFSFIFNTLSKIALGKNRIFHKNKHLLKNSQLLLGEI
jgi:hypothetical protein